jgi:hypothetical protein
MPASPPAALSPKLHAGVAPSGAFRTPGDVIGTALAMLFEEIEDGIVCDARANEPRFTLEEVEEEVRSLGKIK